MESTGVYWIALFELLETEGFTVILFGGGRLGDREQFRPSNQEAERDLTRGGVVRVGDLPEHAAFAVLERLRSGFSSLSKAPCFEAE